MADEPKSDNEEERDRRAANIFLAVVFVLIVGIGIWLVNAMIDYRRIDNCLAQGGRDCGRIDAPAR